MQYTYSYLTDLKFGYGQIGPDYTPFNPFLHDKLPLDFFTDSSGNNEVYFKRYLWSHEQFVNDQFAAVPNMRLFKEWSYANPDRSDWLERVKLFRSINKGLYIDNKREFDHINDSIPNQYEYLNAFIPLRQQAYNLIRDSHTTFKTFNTDVYLPKLYPLAVKYILNTSDKFILCGNPYSHKLKVLPYNTRFKGRYILDVNKKLNLEIPFLAKYKKFHFLTITVDPKKFDNVLQARNHLSILWNRVWTSIKKRYEHGDFHLFFMKTFEFQGNSYPHLHVLIGGVGWISSKWLRSLKGMNEQWFKSIYLKGYDYKGAFRYLFKYVIKNTVYVDSSNDNSIIDSLTPDNDFLKEKVIAWALNMRTFSHSQHIDHYERILSNSVTSRVRLRYPYSSLFNPLLHSPLKLEFSLFVKKKQTRVFRDISTSSHLKYFVTFASRFSGHKRLRKKLTFKLHTIMFKPVIQTNSKMQSKFNSDLPVILDFYLDYHTYIFEFIHSKSYWGISRLKSDHLSFDLLHGNSHFAMGRVKEYLLYLLNESFVSPHNSNNYLKTDNLLTGLSKYRPYQSHLKI